MHILCYINFYCKDDSFAEKDRQSLEIVTGWGTIWAGSFFSGRTFDIQGGL